MANNSILNSQLYKVANSENFYSVEDLIREIHENLNEDRELINSLLTKALSDSEDLASQIKLNNEIDSLPNVMIFGSIPNEYLNSLNNNISNKIQLLNVIQRLQNTYVADSRNRKIPEKGESSLENIWDDIANDE